MEIIASRTKEMKFMLVNANEYFSKPGPRTIAGLEILAKIINPEAFRNIESPSNSIVKVINK